MAAAPPSRSQIARIVHGAIGFGLVAFGGVAVALRAGGSFPDGPPTPAARTALITAACVAFAASALLRRALPAANGTQTTDAWWQANLGRAVAVWASAEGGALLGILLYLLQGRIVGLGVGAVGLVVLALTAPGQLTDG